MALSFILTRWTHSIFLQHCFGECFSRALFRCQNSTTSHVRRSNKEKWQNGANWTCSDKIYGQELGICNSRSSPANKKKFECFPTNDEEMEERASEKTFTWAKVLFGKFFMRISTWRNRDILLFHGINKISNY